MSKLEVKFKKFHPDAVMPNKAYDGDFCFDVVAVSCEQVAENVYKYSLGLGFQIIRDSFDGLLDDFDLSIDLRPRSSVWKTGMVLSYCEGTIDEFFTGNCSAVFYHVMPDMPKYEVGDRIGQIKIGLALKAKFIEVAELVDTVRGENGYGSSGLK